LLLVARVAAAEPICDRGEIDRMDRWHFGWAAAYGALTVGQLGLVAAKWNPLGPFDREFRDTLLVGGIESGLGAVAMLLSPRLDCDRAKSAKIERTLFWGGHAGNLIVNLTGSLILAHETSWSTGAVSFALGYPIGLLNTYTMPRASWHAMRIAALPIAHGGTLVVIGTF
jgi:hypothetical protein